MKKKLLSLTVAAALAGVAGSAQAVSVNQDGMGEVLIYPFFTVEGGQDTYINLVNTTDKYKAVKVRFLEAMNSQEVLDFNLYLSPQDHWSAVITSEGDGAVIKTGDTSCTVPNSLAASAEGQMGATVPFRDIEYSDDSINGLARTREGYVEIIEMAEIADTRSGDANLQTAIKHVQGIPGDCGKLAAAWGANGDFNNLPVAGLTVSEPAGGLYGYGVLIDVAEGTDATYDAVALDSFSDAAIHFRPGSNLPALTQAQPANATVYTADGSSLFTAEFLDGIDAVSATLMHTSLANDYVLEPSIQAGTDWVMTLPTKREYVNRDNGLPATDANAHIAAFAEPFTAGWDSKKSQACEAIDIEYYDREERQVTQDLDFSPERTVAGSSICFEANVLTFNNSNVLEGSDRVKSNLNVNYNNGWARVSFNKSGNVLDNDTAVAANGTLTNYEFSGLPVVGFAVQKYVNGDVGGLMSNYAGSVTHKATRSNRVKP